MSATNNSASATAANDSANVVSKVLVYEHDKQACDGLKQFFDSANLVGYRATKDKLFRVLKSSIDLGAVFLTEHDARGNNNMEMAIEVHRARPELPIFLRRESSTTLDDLPLELQKVFAGAYLRSDLPALKELTESYLFTRHYPAEFVSGIKEMSMDAFKAAFKNMAVVVEPPYVVKDKLIYGELFSLMTLESPWCRGYMMLQSEESSIMDVIKARKTSLNPVEPNFRHVNAVLGELSNMIWGSFKNRYGVAGGDNRLRVEVPIIVNHGRKYISFGSEDPQLCFKYSLYDQDTRLQPIVVYQKFVFSLDWSPEKYSESQKKVDAMVSTGELELF